MSESVQIRIALALIRLRSILTLQSISNSLPQRRQDASRRVIQSGLEDSVSKSLQDVEHVTKLHRDLQVRNRQHSVFSD